MLQFLKIKNFQCHKNVELNFHPGVNVIAGTSDSGKSAILKAIVWCLINRPQGLGFRNFSCEKGDVVEASIGMDDHVITRRRSESENAYFLDGKKFVAMKAEVPTEIAHTHALIPLNIQTQFESHYLLSASAGEVAKALNAACDLSIIDHTIRAVNGILTQSKSEAHAVDLALSSLQERKSQLAWVPEVESEMYRILRDWNILRERENFLDGLTQAKDGIHKIFLEISRARKVLPALSSLTEISTELAEIKTDVQRLNRLKELSKTLHIVQLEHKKKTQTVNKISLDTISDLSEQIVKKVSHLDLLKESAAKLRMVQREIAKVRSSQAKAEKDLSEACAALKVCPMCGRSW